MYYRNAAAAVVVYDITKAVSRTRSAADFCKLSVTPSGSVSVIAGEGKGLGQRAAEAGKPKHRDCASW